MGGTNGLPRRQFSGYLPGELFPQFDAPLIEGVNAPDGGFDKSLVFIKGQQHSQGVGIQLFV